jgi:hypothetical protein
MKKELTPEQIAELIKSAGGNASMSSEKAIDAGVGTDYRKNMLKLLKQIKAQSPEAIKEAGRQVYGELDDAAGSRVASTLVKRLPAAALGGIGLLGSMGAEAATTEDIGESPEEEAIMLAERDATEDYKNSPAFAARRAAIEKLRGR